MKDKKQEIELSVLCDESNRQHKIIDRETTNVFTVNAQAEIENDLMEMA